MSQPARRRQIVLWLALALTLWACWWVTQSAQMAEDSLTLPAVAQSANADSRAQRSAHSKSATITTEQSSADQHAISETATGVTTTSRSGATAVTDLFAAMPASEASEPAAATVSAPAMPFTVAGRLQDPAGWMVFLSDGEHEYTVRAGERFAQGWHVLTLDAHRLVLQHGKQHVTVGLDDGENW